MKRSLASALALIGALAACSGSTSPDGSNATSLIGGDSTGSRGNSPPAPGTYVTCNAPAPSDLFPGGEPPSPTGPRVTTWLFNFALQRGPVDLCIDSWRGYTEWPNVSAFGSRFMTSSSVPHTLVVTASGDSTVLASTEVTFAVDTQYTVVFTPRSHLVVLFDTASAPSAGDMSFRIVNVTRGAVDVYVTTGPGTPAGSDTLPPLTPVISNLASEAVSPYLSYPAVPTRVIITAAGDPSAVLLETGRAEATAAPGKVWTVLFGEMSVEDPPIVKLTSEWLKDRD